ncbi:MAG: hypothetical protein HQL53_11525 [Magnetococcales bacterium]|nr:hypothetical protein [Magnetococcales bacterium]
MSSVSQTVQFIEAAGKSGALRLAQKSRQLSHEVVVNNNERAQAAEKELGQSAKAAYSISLGESGPDSQSSASNDPLKQYLRNM